MIEEETFRPVHGPAPRPPTCASEMYRPARGLGGLAQSTLVMMPCARPAKLLIRGIRVRPDGTIFLQHWEPRCRRHVTADWEAWIKEEYPAIGNRRLVIEL